MPFEFSTATRIIFGAGTLREITCLAAEMGRRACVVTGKTDRVDLPGKLDDVTVVPFIAAREPTTSLVTAGAKLARKAECDCVIGIGGGSVLDTAKAISALLTNEGDVTDYLEVVGKGQSLTQPAAPCIAIPTTAGTGAEVTRNAVLTSPVLGDPLRGRVKVSLRSPLMLPNLALVDPELTLPCPPDITASTGLDALTQLLEVFVSRRANPLTDGFCREGIPRAARALPRAFADGQDRSAREDMSLSALLGGLALANAKLGAVHGFAGPVGGICPASHGVICGRLLPHVMEANVQALRTREPESPALARYDEAAQLLTGNPAAVANDGIAFIRTLCNRMRLPPLAQYGFTPDHFADAVVRTKSSSSLKGNPIALTPDELTAILTAERK